MAVKRFQVMALLQAARAYVLGMSETSAKSWGLNRAIFYAAAKRGFKKIQPRKPPQLKIPLKDLKPSERERITKSYDIYTLGDEMAYTVKLKGVMLFTIGGEIQTPEAYDHQIASRFGKSYQKAWQEAVRICQSFDKGVLLSQRYFYESLYKPNRDKLAKKWSEMV
ncbi:hypothetical protein DRP53_10400 [candidate division WOR-3 bacterium]|uniref:Uncharacterized protein n=1 Tax=candidate division WOR-3 bacterium TaxID=2052148 RepID=A0A660SF05_UNCW3|nr:MAG: hypothetical protein DRP53_10400 [candidate division WOR-3 bacterium]